MSKVKVTDFFDGLDDTWTMQICGQAFTIKQLLLGHSVKDFTKDELADIAEMLLD